MYFDKLESPIGTLLIEADNTHLLSVLYPSETDDISAFPVHSNSITGQCITELNEYFAGRRMTFGLPIRFNGTDFQQEVWEALLKIPFGETTTYGAQAEKIENPKAIRAVGTANGKNKINIIVPCHRVIGFNGKLTGYGGGIERKQWLLDHEQAVLRGKSNEHG